MQIEMKSPDQCQSTAIIRMEMRIDYYYVILLVIKLEITDHLLKKGIHGGEERQNTFLSNTDQLNLFKHLHYRIL